jgi:hypothetical protein
MKNAKTHQGRQPTTGHKVSSFRARPKAKAANAAFNAHARRSGSGATKLTAAQGAALAQAGSKTY